MIVVVLSRMLSLFSTVGGAMLQYDAISCNIWGIDRIKSLDTVLLGNDDNIANDLT